MSRDQSDLVETPCIKVCVIDPQSELCIGCGRQRREIAEWLTLTPKARSEIISQLPERLTGLTKNRKRRGGARQRRKPAKPTIIDF